MKIIEPGDSIQIETVPIMVSSLPGVGKTTIANTAEEPLNLDADHGAHRAKGRKRTVKMEGWRDVDELLKQKRLLADHKTIVLDTVGRFLDLATSEIMDENPKWGTPASGLSQKGWGVLKQRFTSLVKSLRDMGKDVVFLAHAKEEKDGEQRVFRPDIQGGSYAEVCKQVDLIGHLFISNGKRLLDFNPTDSWTGKNPCGWPTKAVPDIAENPRFLADLLAAAKKSMSELSVEQEAFAAKVDEWRTAIEAIEDGEGLLKAGESIQNEPQIIKAQVRALFKDRAEVLGLRYDSKSKLYVPKEAA